MQFIDQHKRQMIAAMTRLRIGVTIFLFLLFLTPSNVAALVDSSGAIQEGYKYRAYGEATVLTGATPLMEAIPFMTWISLSSAT